MSESKDIRIVALKCPNCGGALRVPGNADRTYCEHCKSTVLVLNAQTGHGEQDTPEGGEPLSEEAKKRVLKIALWGTVISVGLPIITSVLVFIIIAVVFLVLGLVFVGSGR